VRNNKRGDIWHGYMLSLILGLIVLSLSLFFLFHEYFSEDDTSWEQCRQSLLLRSLSPEKNLLLTTASSKGALPVKCGTKTITIDYKNISRVEREIAETIASSWYMVGEGNFRIFASDTWDGGQLEIPCMILARIHMTEEVREFYVHAHDIKKEKIDIEKALDGSLQGGQRTFWQYLNPSGGPKAFMYFRSWNNGEFWTTTIRERATALTRTPDKEIYSFNLPKYFSPNDGDLFVFFAHPTVRAFNSDEPALQQYMFVIQEEQLHKLGETRWLQYGAKLTDRDTAWATPCSSIETVPS